MAEKKIHFKTQTGMIPCSVPNTSTNYTFNESEVTCVLCKAWLKNQSLPSAKPVPPIPQEPKNPQTWSELVDALNQKVKELEETVKHQDHEMKLYLNAIEGWRKSNADLEVENARLKSEYEGVTKLEVSLRYREKDLKDKIAALESQLAIQKPVSEGNLVIVCSGGCGKTTNDVSPSEFWAGKVEQSPDPEELVPVWTCKECVKALESKEKGK